jgi:hypothetical protein
MYGYFFEDALLGFLCALAIASLCALAIASHWYRLHGIRVTGIALQCKGNNLGHLS